MRLAIVVAALVLSGCCSQPTEKVYEAAEATAEQHQRYAESVARVGDASGFVANWNGALGVMTAWHVVSEQQELQISVTCNRHTQMVGPFKRVGGKTDVAWCRMGRLPARWKPLRVVDADDDLMGRCLAWGYPVGRKEMVAMECEDMGRVTSPKCAQKYPDSRYRVFRGIVTTGMSGGPIVNSMGARAVVSHTGYPCHTSHYGSEVPR